MTNFFFDNRGKLSVVRTSLFFMVIGILFIGGSFAYVAIETEAARTPLHVPPPSNAEEWAVQPSQTRSYQEIYYKVPTTEIDTVVDYYKEQVRQIGGDTCKRLPPNGDFPDYNAEEEGLIPYKWECLFERANVPGVFQTTQVTIHPGVRNSDETLDTVGFTVIRYVQRWQG